MANTNQENAEIKAPLVIACGDEGVQINEGCRFAFAGAGFRLDGFEDALKALKKTLKNYPADDNKLRIVANYENAWIKEQLDLNDWDETSASMQQKVEALADKNGLLYSGELPFADPEELDHGVKGHMVRPQGIHIANKICFTVAGGEEVYNLGQYLISADWLAEADKETAEKVIKAQVEFYQKLAKGMPLSFIIQENGPLGEKVAAANKKVLQSLGYEIA
jgi:hypothetical protein